MGAIKGLRALLGVILCVALGISVWLTVQRQVFHREETTAFGMTFQRVEDDSMAPGISPGDLVVTASREEYALGDVVLCQEGQENSLLRLVGSTGGNFIARGDGQEEGEEILLSPVNIQSQVVASLPGAGGVYEFLSSLWGPLVVLVVGALLLALPSLMGLGKPPKEERSPRYEGRHAR